VDFVRLRVSEGVELQLIGEEMCEHLLAPDTSSGAGTGCDNMTIMIIAILNGRTKEEWYAWVTDRVNKNYGYETPHTIPQLYPQSRVDQFRARRAAREERERSSQDRDGNGNGADFLAGAGPFGGFARILGSTGGISFNPGSGFISNGSNLMFGGNGDDSDDDSMDDMDLESGERSFFSDTMGLGRPKTPDDGATAALLKAKIEEFERDGDDSEMSDNVEDAKSETSESHPSSTTELKPSDLSITKLPPKETTPEPKEGVEAVAQPASEPKGDAWEPSVKVAEGLLDKSEDPTKDVV